VGLISDHQVTGCWHGNGKGGGVSTLPLADLHMSFTFYVVILAFGNLAGAFGSLLARLADRLGRRP
jgi:hypothetical protein